MKKKFLDVGCKTGSSFRIVSNKFGYIPEEGIGVDINESHVKHLSDSGIDSMVANAMDLPFDDGSFELVIFNHVIEHLPDEQSGMKALEECLRVSSKYLYLALPFFDEDSYLNSIKMKTYYSDWTGHKNMVTLKKLKEYLKDYNLDITMQKKLTDSSFSEIHPLNSPEDSHGYDPLIHPKKDILVFEREIWREYIILVDKSSLSNPLSY